MLSVLDADCATYSHSFVHLRSILTPFADKIGISESVRMGGGLTRLHRLFGDPLIELPDQDYRTTRCFLQEIPPKSSGFGNQVDSPLLGEPWNAD